MSRIAELKNERDQKIRERYKVLSDKQIGGKQLYRHTAILYMLSREFYLSPNYIEKIVAGTDENPNQVKPF